MAAAASLTQARSSSSPPACLLLSAFPPASPYDTPPTASAAPGHSAFSSFCLPCPSSGSTSPHSAPPVSHRSCYCFSLFCERPLPILPLASRLSSVIAQGMNSCPAETIRSLDASQLLPPVLKSLIVAAGRCSHVRLFFAAAPSWQWNEKGAPLIPHQIHFTLPCNCVIKEGISFITENMERLEFHNFTLPIDFVKKEERALTFLSDPTHNPERLASV